MSGVKLQMDMGLIRINGPRGVENTPLVTEIWHLKCKQVLELVIFGYTHWIL